MTSNVPEALFFLFVAGFAIQRLNELLGLLFEIDSLTRYKAKKATVLGFVSLGIGLLLSFLDERFCVIHLLRGTPADLLDRLVSGLVLSAGTEGVNSFLKLLGYKKETAKNQAVSAKARANTDLDTLARRRAASGRALLRLAASDPVAAAVIERVACATNYPVGAIQIDFELQGTPLFADRPGLEYLSELLTEYVQEDHSNASISVTEVGKPGLTVNDLIEFVRKKIK